MLTNHQYQPSDINLSDKESDIFKCCRKDTPEDPTCSDCCYDTWKDELKSVVQQYNKVEEKAAQAKKKLSFATDKYQRFKTWLDELNKAEELARKICDQLEIIAGQSDKIWFNSCKAVDAIEILYCMLRDFYMQVDYIKKRYDELQNCINQNNDPALVKDKGILKCLTDYFARLNAIIITRDELIKSIVEAVKIANLIRNSISTQDCNDEFDPCDPNNKPCNCNETSASYYGFKTIICEWYCSFGCDEACVPCGGGTGTGNPGQSSASARSEGPTTTPAEPVGLCSSECELEPGFGFPICNNPYKCELEDCYKKAEEDTKKAGEELKNANREKESLLACKQSLEKAIAEVDPSIRCK
jgi:hypothetical protein